MASSSGHPDGAVSTIALDYPVRPRSRCDEVVRAPLEDCDLDRFAALGAGYVVFVDNSHRLLPNSDATVTFLEGVERHGGSFWMERAPLS